MRFINSICYSYNLVGEILIELILSNAHLYRPLSFRPTPPRRGDDSRRIGRDKSRETGDIDDRYRHSHDDSNNSAPTTHQRQRDYNPSQERSRSRDESAGEFD